MTVSYKTHGFVIKKEDRQEADKVFTVFAKEFGRIEIFAKSIRVISSKLKTGIEIFSVCELEFIQGRHKKTLTDAKVIKRYGNISTTPEKFAVASTILALLEKLVKNPQIDPLLWDIILDAFDKLDHVNTNDKFLYYYFFWNFMESLGYKPELSVCASCSEVLQPKNLYFSNQEGGVICANCKALKKEGLEIMPDTIKVLRLIINKEWQVLSKLKLPLAAKKGLKQVSDHYRNYLIENLTYII